MKSPSLLLALLLISPARAAAPHQHFEGRHTHPLAISPDGTRLFALNTPDGRLSVFDISQPQRIAPLLIAEIPVGLEPVSLRPLTNDQVWVVNEVSDSVSIVNIPQRAVVETLRTPDEPADVAFANGQAFVSCARNAQIRVFDIATRTETALIPLQGLFPRALTLSPDGSTLYAACLLSGNQTTILPAPLAPLQPAPTNPALPPPPRTALIVPASDPRIAHRVLDHDVAEISTSSHHVLRWFGGLGTHLFDLAIHPKTGQLWVANSQSLNLPRFEPTLRGHFVDHRLSLLSLTSGDIAIRDLNPNLDYSLLPNPAAQATALAQPTAIAFHPQGTAWIAAFNSDRLAQLAPDGSILARVDLRPSQDSRAMRGPRALALNPDGSRLYVLNKLSHSLSIVDPSRASLLGEIPLGSYDPTPAHIKAGRGYLFDARLSGNGTSSCASCHLDADHDGLAWDLGDPNGSLITVPGQNLSSHDLTLQNRVLHPMKGPLVTQTLRGLTAGQKFHWRGDRATLADFNPTFRDLMGGSLVDADDIADLQAYLLSLKHHPNPNRNLDNTRPASLQGGNANTGRLLFLNHTKSHCAVCHTLPTGSDNNIDLMQEVGSTQPVKTAPLRTIYQRTAFTNKAASTSLSGFGLLKDGTGSLDSLPIGHAYVLDDLSTPQEFRDLTAFLLSFDTGTPPATGYSRTVQSLPPSGSPAETDLNLLESRATTSENDLVVRGLLRGQPRQFLWDKSLARYLPDAAAAPPLTRSLLLALLQPGDALTFTACLPGLGSARGIDRDQDGIPDADEPAPQPTLANSLGQALLSWEAHFPDWFPESSPSLAHPSWTPLTAPSASSGDRLEVAPPRRAPTQFFRLRRTW